MKQAFTLIELLVAVLIIGILAAVAVPQYQKAVWKSRNTQLKLLAKSVMDAENVYFLTNNEYSTRFDQLDVDLPLSAPARAACGITIGSKDAVRQGNNFQIILNGPSGDDISITALYTEGPYACQGFSVPKTGVILCREKPMEGFSFGDFCKKIENSPTDAPDDGPWALYTLP